MASLILKVTYCAPRTNAYVLQLFGSRLLNRLDGYYNMIRTSCTVTTFKIRYRVVWKLEHDIV